MAEVNPAAPAGRSIRTTRTGGTGRGRAVTPGGQGRYRGYDVLDQVGHWDDLTAGVVLARLDPHPDASFFSPAERATAEALVNRLLAQRDEPRINVVNLIDQRLALDETDGWFYEDMPEDRQAWRETLVHLDTDARDRHGAAFHLLDWGQQGELIQAVQDAEDYHGLPAKHVWSLWTRYACAAFYSHPWAWNEIGFGGPAYPRGYKAIGTERREGWEVVESDAADPVPWAQRTEAARRRHAGESG